MPYPDLVMSDLVDGPSEADKMKTLLLVLLRVENPSDIIEMLGLIDP